MPAGGVKDDRWMGRGERDRQQEVKSMTARQAGVNMTANSKK